MDVHGLSWMEMDGCSSMYLDGYDGYGSWLMDIDGYWWILMDIEWLMD